MSKNALVKQMLAEGKGTEDILTELTKLYISEGKDEKWAKSRAKSKLSFCVKERKAVKAETAETPAV